MRRLINQLIPFLLIGVAIVAFVFGLMLLAYLLLFGVIVGLGLFLISWIKNKFFASKSNLPKKNPTPRKGRVIDSDDWKEL